MTETTDLKIDRGTTGSSSEVKPFLTHRKHNEWVVQ